MRTTGSTPAPRHLLTPLSLAVMLTMGGIAIPTFAANPASATYTYNLNTGTLDATLTRIARQAGKVIVIDPQLVRGLTAPVIQGELTPEQAFSRALQGSGLEVIEQQGSYSLRRAPQAAVGKLKTVKVTAEADHGNSYATKVASIVRGTESLKEVPQSVSVITSKLIEDQNLTMMSDAMAKAPGIVATTDGQGNPEFRSRGFLIDNYQIDNMGTSYSSTFKPDFDLAIYDQVEVLRGADGLFSAAGEPSGTINLVRKRPTNELRSSVSLAYGSWDNSRIEADIGGAIALDGQLRGRVVGVWQDRDFFYSPSDEEKQVIYGVLEYDLTASTKISGGVSYQRVDGVLWMSGLPTYSDGSQLNIPRDVALTTDWATRETTIREAFFTAEHTFNDDWSAKLNTMQQRYDFDYMQLNLNGPVNPATGIFGQPNANAGDDGNHSDGIDLSLTGSFNAWGLKHKLVAGIDSRSSDGKQMRNTLDVAFPNGEVGIDDFPGLILPEPTRDGSGYGWPAFGSKQEGIYAKLSLQATDKMHVIFGGRYSNYKHRDVYEEYDAAGNVIDRDTSWQWRDDKILTPYVAINYELTANWTTYASVTEVYKPQDKYAGPPENTTKLDPITGSNYELGTKGSVLDGALDVSAALYRIARNDEAIADTRYGENSNLWLPLGKVVSEGLELEASGELATGWEIFASYTYNRNEDENNGAIFSALTPKHIFKLWTDYNLPAFSKLTLGGGVTAKSEHANTGIYWVRTDAGWTQPSFEINQGGYAVWDARVNYQISDSWGLALNVNNIFDENYYATLGRPNGGNWYGTPRNATVTLRGAF